MCGITGFADLSGRSSKETLVKMTAPIFHRGPDDSGAEFITHNNTSVGLGFRRLAILDLSPNGHQPMYNPSNGNWIVFNGEVYNFQEIKTELEKTGHQFRSTGDTEVILKAYQEWGERCVDKFIGMFAIVIYDGAKEKLVCFRDRAGVKPFYYYLNDGLFLFASELKSIYAHPEFKKQIDFNALSGYFKHGYIHAPQTIFENTFKLTPGHWMEFSLNDGSVSTHCYWNVESAFNLPKFNFGYDDALKELDKLLTSAFNYRLISDVPVGVFLSGGYDSSCVAAILQKSNSARINTYTIGFEDEKYNEAPFAAQVAKHIGTNHHEYTCTFSEARELIPKLPEIYDEPFGDSSAIPTVLVSKMARQHVTVALSADGGDELFAGYPRHRKSLKQIRKLKSVPELIKNILSPLVPVGSGNLAWANRKEKLREILRANNDIRVFDIINETFTSGELLRLLIKDGSLNGKSLLIDSKVQGSTMDKILAHEYKTYLPGDILQKVDRATMSVSLEGREPFLDHRIAEFVSRLPDHFKMNDLTQKVLLKDIVHQYIPKEIMDRKKMGFGVPVSDWCRNELKELFMDAMSDVALEESGIFNVKNVSLMRDTYMKNGLENFERIWFIFMYQLWFKKWL